MSLKNEVVLWYHSLSCSCPYIQPSVTAIIFNLDSPINRTFFSIVKCWCFLVHLKCLALFHLLGSGSETTRYPSFDRTLLILCCLFS